MSAWLVVSHYRDNDRVVEGVFPDRAGAEWAIREVQRFRNEDEMPKMTVEERVSMCDPIDP